MRNLRGLITLLIVTAIGSGCATTETFIEPVCLPSRPVLVNMTIVDQTAFRAWNEQLYTDVAVNDLLLKRYAATVEGLVTIHNGQFEASCP